MLLFLTLKHSFYSREIRNFLEMNFTGATIWKNIFTTNKSTVETAWFLKQWSHWCRVLLTHPWKGCSVWLWSWHDIFRNSKAHGVFVECLQFSGMSSVQFSRSVVSYSFRPHESQHARPPSPSPTPRVYPNSCPSSWWCHSAISSSVVPFSSCLQSLPASGSFPMSQFVTSGGQSIGVSASTSVLPVITQVWSPLGWTGWISLPSKGLSGVFSNTTVQKHQFFSTQLSSQSNSHIHTWPLEKP